MTDDEPGDDEDEVVVSAREPDTYAENVDAVEGSSGWSIDPIGVGIAVVIVVVAGGLLFAGPLSDSSGDPTGPPDAEWTLQRVNDTHVQVAHVGGDPVPARRVVVTVDGERRSPAWEDPVADDVVLVRAPSGSNVSVYWVYEDRRERLARWET